MSPDSSPPEADPPDSGTGSEPPPVEASSEPSPVESSSEPSPPVEPSAAPPPPEPSPEPPSVEPSASESPPVEPSSEPPPVETRSEPPVAVTSSEPPAAAAQMPRTGHLRMLGVIVMLGGLILLAAGAFTWFVVRDQLSDEKITVSEDADHFGGEKVDGPLTAYAEADVINEHALEETDGLTYAQLERDDPRRETAVTASFLRASLYTSVVSFGVAVFAFGLGLLMMLIGWALLRIERSLRAQRSLLTATT
jgi:hypothetical protein